MSWWNMSHNSDVCDPCAKLATSVGTAIEKRTKGFGLGVLAAAGITIFCVVGLTYLNDWSRYKKTESQTFGFVRVVTDFRKTNTYS